MRSDHLTKHYKTHINTKNLWKEKSLQCLWVWCILMRIYWPSWTAHVWQRNWKDDYVQRWLGSWKAPFCTWTGITHQFWSSEWVGRHCAPSLSPPSSHAVSSFSPWIQPCYTNSPLSFSPQSLRWGSFQCSWFLAASCSELTLAKAYTAVTFFYIYIYHNAQIVDGKNGYCDLCRSYVVKISRTWHADIMGLELAYVMHMCWPYTFLCQSSICG